MSLTHYRRSALNDVRYLATDAHIICKSLDIPKEILLEIIKQLCLSWKSTDINWHMTFRLNDVKFQNVGVKKYGHLKLLDHPIHDKYTFKSDKIVANLIVSTESVIDHDMLHYMINKKIICARFPKALQKINGKEKNVINYVYWLKDSQLYELF